MAKEKRKLGEILVAEGLLNDESLANALAEQRKWGGRLGSVLIRMGLVSEEELAGVLERQLDIRCVTLHDREIDRTALAALPVALAKQYTVFPVRLVGKTLTLAMVDPLDIPTIDDLQFRLNVRVVPALALESEITRAIAVHYDGAIVESFSPPPRPQRVTEEPAAEREISGETISGETISGEKIPGLIPSTPGGIGVSGTGQPEGPTAAVKGPTHKQVLETLVAMLLEKGIIERDEFLERLKKS